MSPEKVLEKSWKIVFEKGYEPWIQMSVHFRNVQHVAILCQNVNVMIFLKKNPKFFGHKVLTQSSASIMQQTDSMQP